MFNRARALDVLIWSKALRFSNLFLNDEMEEARKNRTLAFPDVYHLLNRNWQTAFSSS
jgi:hypothetical protein